MDAIKINKLKQLVYEIEELESEICSFGTDTETEDKLLKKRIKLNELIKKL